MVNRSDDMFNTVQNEFVNVINWKFSIFPNGLLSTKYLKTLFSEKKRYFLTGQQYQLFYYLFKLYRNILCAGARATRVIPTDIIVTGTHDVYYYSILVQDRYHKQTRTSYQIGNRVVKNEKKKEKKSINFKRVRNQVVVCT